jgi:hypothetical protein
MDAVTVDYNGDGRDEIAAFHSRGTSLGVNLWLFPSAGVWLGEPKLGWVSDVSWDLTKIHAVAGDFDGDGLGDIELAYAPQSQQVRIYQLKGTGAGLNPPALAWDSGPGNWDLNAVKFASGDFNGDGKSDLTGLYNYGPGSARFWTFAGGTANPVESWFTPSGWEWDRVQ